MRRQSTQAEIDAVVIAQADNSSAWEKPVRARRKRAAKMRLTKIDGEMTDELRPEYDLRALLKTSVRGKYAAKYRAGTNLVLLDPDIAKAFPSGQAVNEALRLVLELNKVSQPRKRNHSHA